MRWRRTASTASRTTSPPARLWAARRRGLKPDRQETAVAETETFPEIREAVRKLCARFPGAYWRALDRERAYPTEFVAALTEAGFLSVLIPEEYGGSGLGLAAGAAV